MPHINIIARTNGVGLDRDVDLVHKALSDAGFEVSVSHCRALSTWSSIFNRAEKYDANIFLERVFPRWLSQAKKNFLIPNQERFPRRHLRHLKRIDGVLCKTQHALGIFSPLADSHYIGFASTDRALAGAGPNYHSYFHLAGRSTLKGTETILDLWRKHPNWPELTLVQCKENAPQSIPRNVRLISKYLTQDELIQEMNRHGNHLCTSLSEGWGHYIVEAMSCKALVVTTDGPPMNELVSPETGMLVKHHRVQARHLGTNFYADPEALANTLTRSFQMSASDKSKIGERARVRFEEISEKFNDSFAKVIRSLLP